MDFISDTFPDTRVHIGLYKLVDKSFEKDTDQAILERKVKLVQLLSTYRNNFTIINCNLVSSLMHLNIAVSRALLNKRDGKLKTDTFGNEIVYYCDLSNNIQHTLQKYGVQNCNQAFFAIFVDFPQEQQLKVKAELKTITACELPNLNEHLDF